MLDFDEAAHLKALRADVYALRADINGLAHKIDAVFRLCVDSNRKTDKMATDIDLLTADLKTFFTAFDAFTANVMTALANAAASNDPAIMALDQSVKDEMAKLATAATAVAATASVPAPAPIPTPTPVVVDPAPAPDPAA